MFKKCAIAYIYAKAIFDIAIKKNNINHWVSILELCSLISQDSLMRSLCFNVLNPKKLAKIIIVVYEDYTKEQLDFLACNFIYIIANNNRILLLSTILEEFKKLLNVYMNSISIEVTSARKLNNNQLKKITEIMTHRLSKTVHIKCCINKDILAGVIIRIEDTVIDCSLKGRILRLNNILQF